MLVRKHRVIRHPSRHILEEVSEGFKEIEGYFDLGGFSANEQPVPNDEVPAQEEASEYFEGEDDDSDGLQVFDREEIEVAIDLFISHLIEQKILRRLAAEQQPSLASTFEWLFGKHHEIVEVAKSFEEHTKGYFGAISYDDMQSAFGESSQIRDIIDKELARHDRK